MGVSVGRLKGKYSRAINMGSYNYLGFAQPTGACADDSEQTTWKCGLSVCSSRHELGIYSGASLYMNCVIQCLTTQSHATLNVHSHSARARAWFCTRPRGQVRCVGLSEA